MKLEQLKKRGGKKDRAIEIGKEGDGLGDKCKEGERRKMESHIMLGCYERGFCERAKCT